MRALLVEQQTTATYPFITGLHEATHCSILHNESIDDAIDTIHRVPVKPSAGNLDSAARRGLAHRRTHPDRDSRCTCEVSARNPSCRASIAGSRCAEVPGTFKPLVCCGDFRSRFMKRPGSHFGRLRREVPFNHPNRILQWTPHALFLCRRVVGRNRRRSTTCAARSNSGRWKKVVHREESRR